MKVAVASQGTDWDSQVDEHFGRARYFVLVDPESHLFSVCCNSACRRTRHSAGMQAAGALLTLGVKAVIAGDIGPKAFATLQAGQIQVYKACRATVREAIGRFRRGKLPLLHEASSREHSVQTRR